MSYDDRPQQLESKFIQLENRFISVESIAYIEIDDILENIVVRFIGNSAPLTINRSQQKDLNVLREYLALQSDARLSDLLRKHQAQSRK